MLDVSSTHYETTPGYMNDDGDFVPEMQHVMYGSPNPYALAADNARDLIGDHPYFQASGDEESDEAIEAGEAMSLVRRDELLTEAFAAAALAKKAQGRARNVYNRGQIANNMGTIESNEVNGHGRAMLPEHMTRLNGAILGLVGDLSGVPAMPGDNKRTANDFIRTYYGGTKESGKARARMKRAIDKRKKLS